MVQRQWTLAPSAKARTANPDAEMICYCCHRKGHRKGDCRTFEKDSKKGVNAFDQAPGLTPGTDAAPSGTPSRVSMIELDDWILAVNVEEHEKMVWINRASDGGQWSCGFSLSARKCA